MHLGISTKLDFPLATLIISKQNKNQTTIKNQLGLISVVTAGFVDIEILSHIWYK